MIKHLERKQCQQVKPSKAMLAGQTFQSFASCAALRKVESYKHVPLGKASVALVHVFQWNGVHNRRLAIMRTSSLILRQKSYNLNNTAFWSKLVLHTIAGLDLCLVRILDDCRQS